MHFDFLRDLITVFAIGGLVVYALRALRVPAIVGLLIAGAAIGPHGLSLVGDTQRVEVLAEIGVVLLLFTVGLEFSLAQLMRMWRIIVLGGAAQVGLCIAAVALAIYWRGDGWGKPVFFGFLAALSSTAIVLRLLGERAKLNAPFGRVSLGILLFQDLCIVPLMLITPFLAGKGSGMGDLGLTLLKAAAVIVGVVLASRWIVPPILARVVKTRSRELFLTLLLVLCLGTAWLTSLAGLSLALGAFLAGLAISESEYSHQAMAEAIPFRDAFGGLFFVSIGMLLDAGFLVRNLPLVAVVVVGLIAIKIATAAIPTTLLGYPPHVGVQVGFALAQVGEFAFVLSKTGLDVGLMDTTEYQVFLSASVVSMVVTPALIAAGLRLSTAVPAAAIERATGPEGAGVEALHDHVVIAGYGVNGQNVAKALSSIGIPYVILEMNPETVRNARARGEPMHYGDCTRHAVLESLGIDKAKMYVVAISDAASTRQSVSLARTINPELYILVRTRFVAEIDELHQLGADEVIPEEFETSIEIFARVLQRFDVPRNIILDQVTRVRGSMYGMLRTAAGSSPARAGTLETFSGAALETVQLRPSSPMLGKSLLEIDLRAKTGALVVAVRRGNETFTPPPVELVFESADQLVLFGDRSAVDAALVALDPTV